MTDGLRVYLEAVESAFGEDVDYAVLQKVYGSDLDAVALNYFAYNFIKIHRTLQVTPAMAANVTNRLFDVSDIVRLLEDTESNKAA